MNKLTKILYATLGGIETIFSLASPIILMTIWVNLFPSNIDWIFYMIGFGASVFRGIKIGGWFD
jgi:hypothetical protein